MSKPRQKKNSDSPSAFCKALKKYDHFLLACHIAPEGDAIGSILAMESLLRRLGKKTTIVSEESFPSRLYCLYTKKWKILNEVKAEPSTFKALVVADCPTLERIGKVKGLVTPDTVIFNIDHHVSNVYFGQHNYVVPDAAASGEVVYEIFQQMKMKLTKDEATSLYVALSTDTGAFKYSSTAARSHEIAAQLIRAGVDLEKVNEELYSTYSLNKINLYSRLLGRVKTEADGKIAWVVMRRRDLDESGATDEDTEGFIDFLKFLKEVKVAFFVTESVEAEHVRVSFRSKDSYDVNKIATFFSGGGHKKASGCRMRATVDEAEAAILDRIRREFKLP